ncbi:MAG: class I SAM-dependent methyltransferase [Myxococcota bacterium]|nr:class I SAM-dependent methyltransferase [Myxococcota bacterium]
MSKRPSPRSSGAKDKPPRTQPKPRRDLADPAPKAGVTLESLRISDFGSAGDFGAQAHYEDPSFYGQAYRQRRHDIDYYVRAARDANGPVLEYGVGNGRIALHVARAGVEIAGVDLSRPMLADFEQKLEREPPSVRRRVTLHHGDMRELALERRFALVTVPFNAFLHLYTRRDVEAFLARVRAHLLPTGTLLFDFSIPSPADLMRDPELRFPSNPLRDPETGEEVAYAERFEYDPLRQLLLVRIELTAPDGSLRTMPLTHRQFFPREMEALLHYNGFEQIFFTADFTDLPLDRHVDSIVVRARPKSAGDGA